MLLLVFLPSEALPFCAYFARKSFILAVPQVIIFHFGLFDANHRIQLYPSTTTGCMQSNEFFFAGVLVFSRAGGGGGVSKQT